MRRQNKMYFMSLYCPVQRYGLAGLVLRQMLQKLVPFVTNKKQFNVKHAYKNQYKF